MECIIPEHNNPIHTSYKTQWGNNNNNKKMPHLGHHC